MLIRCVVESHFVRCVFFLAQRAVKRRLKLLLLLARDVGLLRLEQKVRAAGPAAGYNAGEGLVVDRGTVVACSVWGIGLLTVSR